MVDEIGKLETEISSSSEQKIYFWLDLYALNKESKGR